MDLKISKCSFLEKEKLVDEINNCLRVIFNQTHIFDVCVFDSVLIGNESENYFKYKFFCFAGRFIEKNAS